LFFLGKTSFKKRIISLSHPGRNEKALEEIKEKKKEENMTHGVGK
jgi:hypothetical protein